jgi:hypothetical protein
MASTQKGTQIDLRDMVHINAGLHSLRQALKANLPSDFDWWFTFGPEELVAGFSHVESGDVYLNDVRAETALELLRKWRAIDWRAERARALELARAFDSLAQDVRRAAKE